VIGSIRVRQFNIQYRAILSMWGNPCGFFPAYRSGLRACGRRNRLAACGLRFAVCVVPTCVSMDSFCAGSFEVWKESDVTYRGISAVGLRSELCHSCLFFHLHTLCTYLDWLINCSFFTPAWRRHLSVSKQMRAPHSGGRFRIQRTG
jgi:hypothetical protein